MWIYTLSDKLQAGVGLIAHHNGKQHLDRCEQELSKVSSIFS